MSAVASTRVAPILQAISLNKSFGHVVGLQQADFEVRPGEVMAVIGDNGAGKSTLIKCVTGALRPDSGVIRLNDEPLELSGPRDAQAHGIETVYQTLGVSPVLDIASNIYLGRELVRKGLFGRLTRSLDHKQMRKNALEYLNQLGIQTIQNVKQPVETLSGGQRQAIAVARTAAFATKVVILDEPTAALGVRESGMVLDTVRELRHRGLGVVLISHNMPHVWEVADRVHVQRLGRRIALVDPHENSMSDGVALMTGAITPAELGVQT